MCISVPPPLSNEEISGFNKLIAETDKNARDGQNITIKTFATERRDGLVFNKCMRTIAPDYCGIGKVSAADSQHLPCEEPARHICSLTWRDNVKSCVDQLFTPSGIENVIKQAEIVKFGGQLPTKQAGCRSGNELFCAELKLHSCFLGNIANLRKQTTPEPAKTKSSTESADSQASRSPDDRRQRDERLAQSEGRYREQQAAYDKAYQNKPKKHKQDMEASECLVKSPIGRRSVYNKCSFDVEVSFCMEKPDQKAFEANVFEDGWARDCDQGKGGMWVVSAGKHLSGNYTGAKFHWFACKKPAIPHAKWNPSARELQGYCD